MDPTRSDEQSREIAALAAQIIADSGLDYQSAKRKAVRQVFGDARVSAAMLPDNDAIDQCLLEHLQLYDAKELEIRLLNEGIHFDVSEIAHFAGRQDVPALTFYWQNDLPILISVYRYDDLRGALKRQKGNGGAGRADRGNLAAVRELLGGERHE